MRVLSAMETTAITELLQTAPLMVLGKQHISVALAYDHARLSLVTHGNVMAICCCTLIGWNVENVLDSINIRLRGDEALLVCIFYLRDHVFVSCLQKNNQFSCFGNQFSSFTFRICLFWPNKSQTYTDLYYDLYYVHTQQTEDLNRYPASGTSTAPSLL